MRDSVLGEQLNSNKAIIENEKSLRGLIVFRISDFGLWISDCGTRIVEFGLKIKMDNYLIMGAICSAVITPEGSSIIRIFLKWISPPSDSRQR
jgi:hypothetical protein